MHCPTCAQEFAHRYDPQHGFHVDDHCACGQLLQWDYPVTAAQPSVYLVGAPAPCTHPDQRKLEGLFPLCAR